MCHNLQFKQREEGRIPTNAIMVWNSESELCENAITLRAANNHYLAGGLHLLINIEVLKACQKSIQHRVIYWVWTQQNQLYKSKIANELKLAQRKIAIFIDFNIEILMPIYKMECINLLHVRILCIGTSLLTAWTATSTKHLL